MNSDILLALYPCHTEKAITLKKMMAFVFHLKLKTKSFSAEAATAKERINRRLLTTEVLVELHRLTTAPP